MRVRPFCFLHPEWFTATGCGTGWCSRLHRPGGRRPPRRGPPTVDAAHTPHGSQHRHAGAAGVRQLADVLGPLPVPGRCWAAPGRQTVRRSSAIPGPRWYGPRASRCCSTARRVCRCRPHSWGTRCGFDVRHFLMAAEFGALVPVGVGFARKTGPAGGRPPGPRSGRSRRNRAAPAHRRRHGRRLPPPGRPGR